MKKLNWIWLCLWFLIPKTFALGQNPLNIYQHCDSLETALAAAELKKEELDDSIQQVENLFMKLMYRYNKTYVPKVAGDIIVVVDTMGGFKMWEEVYDPYSESLDSSLSILTEAGKNNDEEIVELRKALEHAYDLRAAENIKQRTIKIKSLGGFLIAGPEYHTEPICYIPEGAIVTIYTDVSLNSYIRAAYLNYYGFIYPATLDQSRELLLILKKPTNNALISEDAEQLKKLESPKQPTDVKKTGKGHRRKYYINAKGKKVYSKDRLIN